MKATFWNKKNPRLSIRLQIKISHSSSKNNVANIEKSTPTSQMSTKNTRTNTNLWIDIMT